MKKKYKNRRPATNILVNVNGAIKSIEFAPAVIEYWGLRGCAYTTEDKEIQAAIEVHPFFGKDGLDGIWTDDVEPKAEKVAEEAAPVEIVAEEIAEHLDGECAAKVARRYKGKKEE